MEPNIDTFLDNFYKNEQNCGIIRRLIPTNDGELLMKNCYINLAVVKHIESENNGSDANHQHVSKEHEEFRELRHSFNRPRSSEELHLEETEDNHHYQIVDLFDDDDVSRRIFMLGRAGIGKTTMCKKIVYEFYVNRLWNDKFNRIIWLPLRIVNRESIKDRENISLVDLYSSHYCSSEEIAKKLVEENEIDESKVLYLLDGLDEIQNVVGNKQSAISHIVDSLLRKPFVIVTSRPYTYHDNYGNFDIILETIGFSQENILDYVSAVFSHPSERQTQKEIIEFIEKSSTNISGMVSVPILLDIICCTWTDIKAIDQSTHITMTRFYSILDKYLWGQFLLRSKTTTAEQWRNTVKKKSEVYALVNETAYIDVDMLSQAAYTMLAMNKIEFTTEDAFAVGFDAQERIDLKNTNFLNCLNPVDESSAEISKSYTFIHLTIQEYLSAVYLVNCFKENRREFDNAIHHKYNPRYSIVWSFVAGILADSSEELGYLDSDLLVERFFNFLERDPTDELGIAHQYLIVSCLNECSYPSLLSSDRESRFINELLSYIFTQYVAGGKSLFKQQQLPLKLLERLIAQPDDYWAADSEVFKKTVLREQFLPEEIVSAILSDIENQTSYSVENFKILTTQNYLGLTAVNTILRKLDNTSTINKHLSILSGKMFLPSNDETMQNIQSLIEYSAKKNSEIKSKVAEVCLNLKQIPFGVIEQLVLKFVKGMKARERGVRDDDWKKEILMGIVKDKQIFTAAKMVQLAKQKCFSGIMDDFLREKILKQPFDVHDLYRLLLLASRRNLENDFIEKLMNSFESEQLRKEPHVKRLILYIFGNMKTLPVNVFNGLFGMLDQNNLTTDLSIRSKDYRHLKYCKDPMRHTPEINFQYLASIVPLMKYEFYDGYQKKRSILKFKRRRFLSQHRFDLNFFRLLHRDIAVDVVRRSMPSVNVRADVHRELVATLECITFDNELTWIADFERDGDKFLKTFSATWGSLFVDWHLEEGNDIRNARKYKILFSEILKEELDIDSKMYYDILVKYRPLVVLAHGLYNTADPPNDSIKKFEEICERQLLELLIVRALRDSKISDNLLEHLKSKFLERIDSNRNRLTMNITKMLEFRKLDDPTIGKIVDLIEVGDEYEVELTLLLLHRQTINEPAEIAKLKMILLENSINQRKCHFVANVFENNPKLLKSVQGDLFRYINAGDFHAKLKVLNVLHNCEIDDEEILLILPDIIKDCREESNWSQLTGRCVTALLNQNKLPETVLDRMTDHFNNLEPQYSGLYLRFLDLLRMPLNKKCIESLYDAMDTQFVSHLSEFVQSITDSERLMRKILKKQPLWNLIASECKHKFKENFGSTRFEHSFTIKEKIISEKILHDNVPMAIQKINGKLGCFAPSDTFPALIEFDDSNGFNGLLQKMYEHSGLELNLPAPLDKHHKYLKFHTPQENLKYILALKTDAIKSFLSDIELQQETEYFYIKASKVSANRVNLKPLIDMLKVECTKFRHIDLRDLDLEDDDVFELKALFDIKGLVTLILSNNRIGIDGLTELLQQLKTSTIDFVFLDRNLVSFTEAQYREFIASDYRQPPLVPANNPKLNVSILDLSLNFISNGDRIHGDPFADEEIEPVRQYDMKESIQRIPEIHSQNLNDELFQDETNSRQIRSYCHSFRHPTESKFIDSKIGCVMVAEKRPTGLIGRFLFNRGHAFMVIEWIPDSDYGQRQIILADLRKIQSEHDRLSIRITAINPHKLRETLKSCVSSRTRTIFELNEDIADKLMRRLFQSRKQIDIFDYFLLPSRVDSEVRGRYNCISWTDEMLKSLNIPNDSMHESRLRVVVFLSIFAAIISAVFFSIFRLIQAGV